jgi:Fe-S cluster assembly iron-binding protein IscA
MPEETVFPPFQVSRAAVSQIEAVGGVVRIDIADGGCCGRKYVFLAGMPDADDQVFGCPGATLALSPVALAALTGAKLDYGAALNPAAIPCSRQPEYSAALPVQPLLRRGVARSW